MADKEDKDVGFAGLGRRVENLKDDVSTEKAEFNQIKKEIPSSKPRGKKQKSSTASTTITKQRLGASSNITFGKIFGGIVVIAIIYLLFAQEF